MKKFKSFALVFAIMLFATGLGLLFDANNSASTQAKVGADAVALDAGLYKVDDSGNKTKTKSWDQIATNSDGKLQVTIGADEGTYLVCGKIPDGVTSLESAFSSTSLTNIEFTADFDTSNITSMYWMFYQSKSLVSLDLSNFNTKKVTNMLQMFGGCKALKILNISGFEISSGVEVGLLFEDTDFGYCDVLSKIISPKTIASDVSMGLPESLTREIVFKDDNGKIYDKMPQGQITLTASPVPYFEFITTAMNEDTKSFEIKAIQNDNYPDILGIYKDKYWVQLGDEETQVILTKYVGTGTNIAIPGKIILEFDAGVINGGKPNGTIAMTITASTTINCSITSNFFGEQADKITSLTFGAAYVDNNVKCSDFLTIVNQLKSLQLLDLSKCDIQSISTSASDLPSEEEINEFLTDTVGMQSADIEKFYGYKTTGDRKQFLLTWMRANMIGEGKLFENDDDFNNAVNNSEIMNEITQYCFVPETSLKYSIKTIKMPTNSSSTPEITLNGDYTYGDNQTTNKFTYGGETLSYVEGTGSVVNDPSSPDTPSTGVMLDVILPVASITIVLASLCAVAFVGKKKKQF